MDTNQDREGFEVTPEWLHRYSTTGIAGWTAAQLKIIGVDWPPPRKWLRRMRGRLITQAQRQAFEQAAVIRRAATGRTVTGSVTSAEACRIWDRYGTR